MNKGEKPTLNPGVLIVNSALGEISGPIGGLETPNTTERNKVRFMDESGRQNNGERRMNQYNKNINLAKYNLSEDTNDSNLNAPVASDLRGLKDAMNQFIPRPTTKATTISKSNNQLPMLPNLESLSQPQNYESDASEHTVSRSYNLPSIALNQNRVPEKPHELLYTISDTFQTPQQMNNRTNTQQSPHLNASIENIYSKVLSVTKPNLQQNQSYENDDQPLYMNTDTYNYQQQPNLKPTYTSWDDSSV